MITLKDSSKQYEYMGLSTDTKPTDCGTNSIFYELDTEKYYYCVNDNGICDWYETGASPTESRNWAIPLQNVTITSDMHIEFDDEERVLESVYTKWPFVKIGDLEPSNNDFFRGTLDGFVFNDEDSNYGNYSGYSLEQWVYPYEDDDDAPFIVYVYGEKGDENGAYVFIGTYADDETYHPVIGDHTISVYTVSSEE